MAVITGTTSRNPSRYTYRLVCDEINLDSSNNTSQLQVAIQIVTGGTSGTTYAIRSSTASHSVTIDGTTYYFTTGNYSLIGGQTITLGTVVSNPITHNSDGTKTVSVSASSPDLAQGNGYGPYSGSASGNVTLATLHKSPTINSYTITERNSALTNAGVANNVFVKNLSIKRFTLSDSDVTFYDGATHSSTRVWNLMSAQDNIPGSPNIVDFDFRVKELKLYDTTSNKAPIVVNVQDSMGGGANKPSSGVDLYDTILYENVTITDTSTYAKRYGQLSGRVNVNVQGTYYNGVVGNKDQSGSYKPTIKYKFWRVGTTEPSTYAYTIPSSNITINNGTYTVTNYDIGTSTESATNYFNPDYAYRVKFQVNDNFTTVTSGEKPIPVGEATWTEYADRVDFAKITIRGVNPFEYSTEERKVGIWYDGKPIYSKTIVNSGEIVFNANTWTTIDNVSSLNINQIIDCKVMNYSGYYWSSYMTRINSGNFQLFNTTGVSWGGRYFTIYYTKTTD